MGIKFSTEKKSIRKEGAIAYNLDKNKVISNDSPFISTETFNMIKNNDVVDTPMSEQDGGNNYPIELNNYDDMILSEQQLGGELFIKSNVTDSPTIISLEGITSVKSQQGGAAEEMQVISLDGFSSSSTSQKGGGDKFSHLGYGSEPDEMLSDDDKYNVISENVVNASELSFELDERPIGFNEHRDQESPAKLNDEDLFSVSLVDVANSKPSRSRSRSRSKKRGSSRSKNRRSSRKRSKSRKSSKSKRKKSSKKRGKKKQRGGESSEAKYHFSQTSEELLSSPQVGGAYYDSSDASSDRSSDIDSDSQNFRIKGTRVIN